MRPPKRQSGSEQIARLQEELQRRLSQLDAARQEQDELLLRQKVLAHFCDSLALLRQQRACASGGGDASLAQLQEEWASDAEAALLQQLHALPCRASIVPTWHWAAGGAHARIGFAFVRHVTTQPLLPGAATMTLAELAASFSATVKELALLLHVVEAGGAPPTDECSGGGRGSSAPAPAPYERLKELLLCHLHRLVSIEQSGREEVAAGLTLTNCDTGERQLPAADHERHRWVAQRLRLSRLQRREIGESVRLSHHLRAPLRREVAHLRALLADAGDAVPVGLEQEQQLAVAAAAGGASPAGNSLQQQRGASVQERQHWAQRLSILMRKDRWLLTVAAGMVVSCLTWAQLAKAYVFMHPYHPAFAVLAAVIADAPDS